MERYPRKFYLYGYLNKHTSLSLNPITKGLPKLHPQNASLNMSIHPNGLQRIFLKNKDITKKQLPFGYHKNNAGLIQPLMIPIRMLNSLYHWNRKQPPPTQVEHVTTNPHNLMENHSEQQVKYSLTSHDKAKWIPK